MKCELKARARDAAISRVLSTLVAMLMAATFTHAWMNDGLGVLALSLGLALALVLYVLGRFPD